MEYTSSSGSSYSSPSSSMVYSLSDVGGDSHDITVPLRLPVELGSPCLRVRAKAPPAFFWDFAALDKLGLDWIACTSQVAAL